MIYLRSIRVSLVGALVLGLAFTVTSRSVRAAVPTAPSNLTAVVTGQIVNLSWTAGGNSPTQQIIRAGFAPGQTALSVPVGGTATSFTASAGPGTYFVRIVAVNADGTSPESNEVTVVVSSGCSPPSAPRNLRAMIRGAELFLHWIPPASGAPSAGYSLQAGTGPGQTFAQFNTNATTMNATVPAGTYALRVIARNNCGNSASSNELMPTFPSNAGREADPDPGTVLGLPDIQALLARLGAQNPPTEATTCPNGRKYEPNPWLNQMVDSLRGYSPRFGYNAKPTRTAVDNNGFPVIAAGDEIAYFRGAGNAQGSSQVYAIDILFNHCGGNPSMTYRDIAPEPAIWTGAGRFTGDQR